MNLTQIGQIAIPAEDLERAVAFYRDTLGMQFLFQVPPGLAFFNCGGIRLMIDGIKEREIKESFSPIIYYKVADIQASYEELSGRGVLFHSKPHLIAKMPDHELWMAFLHDTEKNLIGLMSEVR
jgi:methylmalonyl-CoA/ethylmalonyl-CoA epimerase